MVKITDTKLTADIDTQPIDEYVTFWGKIKGAIEKQTDLISLFNSVNDMYYDLNKRYLLLKAEVAKVVNIFVNDVQHNIKKIFLDKVDETSEGPINILTYEFNNESSEDILDVARVTTKEYVDNKDDILTQDISTINDELTAHVNDDGIHVTLEGKESWDSKVDTVYSLSGSGVEVVEIPQPNSNLLHSYRITNTAPDKTYRVIVTCTEVSSNGVPSAGISNSSVSDIITALNDGRLVYVYTSYAQNNMMISPLTCITTLAEMIDDQEVYETVAVFTFNHQTGGYGVDWKWAYADLIIHENKFVKFEWKKHFVEEE